MCLRTVLEDFKSMFFKKGQKLQNFVFRGVPFRTVPFVLLFLAGCASTSTQTVATKPLSAPYQQGVYHTVLKGETLWRIAKSYNTDISRIVETNRMPDPSDIDAGQKIFIPGARTNVKVSQYMPVSKESRKGYIWPLKGRIISYYGSKVDGVKNKGIDIQVSKNQPIVASRSGKVVFCDERVKGMGKVIIIEHDNGYSTVYGNNSENLVKCGEFVRQNQVIAKAGDTGRAKAPSLHFEIRRGHEPKNPYYYLP